jgi:hypothetical protein
MKRLLSAALAGVCLLLGAVAAHALALSSLTVVVRYGGTPLEGIGVAAARVAFATEENGALAFEPVPGLANAGIDFAALLRNKNAVPQTILNAYAAGTLATTTQTTNSEGRAVFPDLAAGIHLVVQTNANAGQYEFAPFLAATPEGSAPGWNYAVAAYPKLMKKPDGQAVSVSAYKIWKGTPQGSVLVQLYGDGKAFGAPALLNTGNYWNHTWNGLDPKVAWTVDEPAVPDGYMKSIAGSAANGFVITNTKIPGWVPPPLPGQPSSGGFFLLVKAVAAKVGSWFQGGTAGGQPGAAADPNNPGALTYTPSGGSSVLPPAGQAGNAGTGPNTNDTSNLWFWIVLILASCLGLCLTIWLLVRSRRRKRLL